MLKKLNSCNKLSLYANCNECVLQSESFAPAQSSKEKCIVADLPMLLNCNNKSENYKRICPCLVTNSALEKN